MGQEEFSYSQIAKSGRWVYPFSMELNLRIRELREARGYKLRHLAEMIGVSVPHLSDVERGKKRLNSTLMVRIANSLGVEPSDLVAGANREDVAELVKALQELPAEDRARVHAFAMALRASQQDIEQNQ